MVFTTPAIKGVRERFPDAHLAYLVERAAEPVVRHNPHLNEVIVADRPRGLARVAYDMRLARRLRRARYDLVIDLHGGPRSAWLTWATAAPQRIGYDLPGRGWLYTDRIPWTRSLVPPRHSVLNQWDLLGPLGIAAPDRARHAVEMPEHPDAAAAVRARLASAHVPADARLVVMHVSAGNPFRRWPADAFADVAATLAMDDPSRRIIITSGPSEEGAADRIARDAAARAGEAAARIVRCGEFSLAELRSLVARSALYIGGDSGPMHIAATTRTPIVALFGPTLAERSMPWRSDAVRAVSVDGGALACRPCHQRECVHGDFRCLTGIAPSRVIDAARKLLSE